MLSWSKFMEQVLPKLFRTVLLVLEHSEGSVFVEFVEEAFSTGVTGSTIGTGFDIVSLKGPINLALTLQKLNLIH